MPPTSLPSAALRLGYLSLGLGCLSVVAGLLYGRLGGDLEGLTTPQALMTVVLPFVLLPALSLGVVGAAFAEGVLKRSSILGVSLAGAGAALPWLQCWWWSIWSGCASC